jgi:hypothetical protein
LISERNVEDFQAQVASAIRQVQVSVRWKPGKGQRHLAKRIRQGHLPPATTLAEYEAIILAIVSHPDAFVFVYRYGSTDYPTLVAPYKGRIWLAMFSLDGIIETALPPDEPDTYFSAEPRYIPVGLVKEMPL